MQDVQGDSRAASTRRLAADETPPFVAINPGAASPFLLVGDHAGREIPRSLGALGLGQADLDRHIAWDIGVAALGRELAVRLGAAFIAQRFSRLVIDCNRDPARADSICETSDGTTILGNLDLTSQDRQARHAEIFAPYHARIAAELDARRGRPTVLVALHSFTPRMDERDRPWRYGVLHMDDSPFCRATLAALRAELGDAVVGDNEPYRMDEVDYTAPHHAIGRGLDYLELEVRQDLIADPAGACEVADLLARLLPQALAQAAG